MTSADVYPITVEFEQWFEKQVVPNFDETGDDSRASRLRRAMMRGQVITMYNIMRSNLPEYEGGHADILLDDEYGVSHANAVKFYTDVCKDLLLTLQMTLTD